MIYFLACWTRNR